MGNRLEGKVALVTGAARGQGRAHAIRMAEEGADIIAIDICGPVDGVVYDAPGSDDLVQTAKEVEATGRRVIAREGDIRDLARLREIVAEGVAELGRLDIVVANAGILISAAWNDVTPKIWQDTIDVNLTGTWNTLMATIPTLVEQGTGGSVIITSSAAGLKGLPFMNPYTASKWGVTGLAKAFAHELARYNIRVNTVHPCGVNTPLGTMGGNNLQAGIADNPRLGGMFVNSLEVELIEPEDMTHSVVYLASDESRFTTASAVTVDAGTTQY